MVNIGNLVKGQFFVEFEVRIAIGRVEMIVGAEPVQPITSCWGCSLAVSAKTVFRIPVRVGERLHSLVSGHVRLLRHKSPGHSAGSKLQTRVNQCRETAALERSVKISNRIK